MPMENNVKLDWSPRDFSTLKKPKHNKEPVLSPGTQNISASQLFNYNDEDVDQHLHRSASQPNIITQHEKNSRKSLSRRPKKHVRETYWDKKENNDSSSSTTSVEEPTCTDFETMYEIIQQKLQRHLRRQEILSHEDIQKACHELRRQALVAELADGWQNSLSDLEIASGMKLEVLEAIYMLRNAHRGDLFSSEENVNNNNNNDETDGSHDDSLMSSTPDTTMLPKLNRPSSLAFTRRTDSFTSSGEGTPTNLSSPSSGQSTPSFRKKPKRPEIKLSEHNKQYRDYIEILRAESLQSLHSDADTSGEPNSSRDSCVEISEEMIAKAFLSSHMRSEMGDSRESLDRLKAQKLCMQRPLSPTSQFLIPLLEAEDSDNLLTEIHDKLSPALNKLKKFEDESQQISALQVKISVLQEEKRQLAALLKDKREESAEDKRRFKDVAVQKHFEIITEISHSSSQTDRPPATRSILSGGNNPAEVFTKEISIQKQIMMIDTACQNENLSADTSECATETDPPSPSIDCGTDPLPNDITTTSVACQQTPSNNTNHTQTEKSPTNSVSLMVGSATKELVETSVGRDETFVQNTQGVQTTAREQNSTAFQTEHIETVSKGVQAEKPLGNDFCCGDKIADLKMVDQATSHNPELKDSSMNTDQHLTRDFGVQSSTTDCSTVGVGEGSVYDVICDRCSTLQTRDFGSGSHVTGDAPCNVDDKLCDCVKPKTSTVAVGDHTLDNNFCDKCDNLQTRSVGVSDDLMTDLLCDKCTNLEQHEVSVGGDYDINHITCDDCDNKPTTVSIGTGDGDVTNDKCENCENNNGENVFNFDFNITTKDANSHVHQQPIICHFCGNKVDLSDDSLDETLQTMRDSMQTLAGQRGGLKRSDARKHLNLDLNDEYRGGAMYQSKESVVVTPSSEESYNPSVGQSDEEDDSNSSHHDDVIQACKMLHNHFSGEKPLKQQQMMKYMAVIQALWFKSVKKRRTNASVVKSYIDLFQQRIPELLETICNLSDDEGNTALHFAMTYKNLGVASILLDSGECCVDLVNQAGYSPLMLAALVGFERKNDKYVMQRIVRLGNINKESAETGQTPLMLAVSNGNASMVDLLLDAGCDINAVDDEGSTALMCACEHGTTNIVKMLLANPDCDATIEDNEGSTALSISMDSRRKDLALLIYGSLNFDARGRIKLSPSKQSLLGLGRRSPSPVIGRR